MEKLRYNRVYKQGMIAILFCILLFGSVFVFSLIAKFQYDNLVSDMIHTKATITDIDLDIHLKGPDEQEMYVKYEVDGVVYNRELETDTKLSFAAGSGAHYSVGDKIDIFYDPQNPEKIAVPRSMVVGYFWMIGSFVFLLLVLWILRYMIKNSKKFLITQAEYEKEKKKPLKAEIKKK